LEDHVVLRNNGVIVAGFGQVAKKVLDRFDIRQPVYFAGLNWEKLLEYATANKNVVNELARFPAVERDIAMVVSRELPYESVEQTVQKLKLPKLRSMRLFDIFESDKLGKDKKSMAVSFKFQDEAKTLTDKEIEGWMDTIMKGLEKELQAEIRKQ
jgi:phenylalanyl-tRNA synthetase beta chain